MIIYNVTVKVEHSIATAWLKWLQQEHIPDMLTTGCFNHAAIHHLFEADDEEGITYAVQYHSPTQASYNHYLTTFAETMKKKSIDKWGNKFIAFKTAMRVVN